MMEKELVAIKDAHDEYTGAMVVCGICNVHTSNALRKINTAMDEADKRLKDVIGDRDQLEDAYAILEQNYEKMSEKVNTMMENNESLRQCNEAGAEQYESLLSKNKQLRDEITELTRREKEWEQQRANGEEKYVELLGEYNDLNEAHENLDAENKKLREEYTALERRFSKHIVNNDVEKVSKRVAFLEDKLREMAGQNERLIADRMNKSGLLGEANAEIKALRRLVAKKEQQNAVLQIQADTKDEIILTMSQSRNKDN